MPHSFGKRARCRDKFSKGYKKKGMPNVSTYLTTFKVGEYVDVVADSSIQKGMPYHFYHGRTGTIFNVTRNAVGVEMTKIVGNRQMRKRFHVRIEHVRKSRCQEDFLQRKAENVEKLADAKASGKQTVKREPVGPKGGKIVDATSVEVKVLQALPYTEHYL